MPTILPIAFVLMACKGDPAATSDTTDSGNPSTSTPTTLVIETPSVVIVDAPTPVVGDLEWIAAGDVSGVAAFDNITVLYSADSELVSVDPVGRSVPWGPTPGALVAAVRWGDVGLISVGGDLYDWDGVALRPSVLTPVVGTASKLVLRGEDVWIGADDGLRRWRNGQVVSVTLGDDEVGAFAVGGDVRGYEVVWVADGDILHGVGNSGSNWVDLEAVQIAGSVDSVAVDRTGQAWAAGGGWLHHRDPDVGWRRLDLGAPVWEVYGNAEAEGVWVEMEDRWLRTTGIEWESVTGLPAPVAAQPPSVDGSGRLLLHDEEGAWRASTTRPLVVLGVEPGMVVGRATDVMLLPTAPGSVQGLTADLVDSAGDRVSLEVAEGAVIVDPDGLASGAWTFRAEARYGSSTSVTEVPVFLGAGFEPTWETDIQPIYQNECALCHDGAAKTVLETPEDWEDVIDLVLYNVEVGNMPLGGTPLSDVQVVVIQAWKDNGFLR